MPKFQVDVNKAVGHQYPPQKVSFNKRDLILYALSIGVKEDEFKYLYELDKNFTPFPTYPVVLFLKGDSPDVNLFAETINISGPTPGLPDMDPNRIVHGEQKIAILNQLPTSGEFELRSKLSGVYDKGKGILLERTYTLVDPKIDKEYCVLTTQSFVIGYGGFGGSKGQISPSYKPPKDKKPDVVDVCSTSKNQAILYRLSGDYNPLHIDLKVAPKLGFERPILHGLCSYGIAAHAIIKHLANNNPELLKSISVRFTAPVFPGDTLETLMWKVPSEKSDEINVIFITKAKERDSIVLGNGLAILKNDKINAKL
ncbi:Thioesterase/thiol ester dehydrase-isomerase [Rhizophagus irregularis]|uniref:Thioesterase/thiol ester dehydrase-isomerase n=1 Tax=Rhizophagus irregularis TaxID=588596 RepID=A0A2I1G9J9_9GLOM|nr:Thioesterase/thiol ester dehydrase-isomerase [Rhizophagus irregularis]